MEGVEGKLDRIIKNTKPKISFMITFTGKGSRIEKTFQPEIAITAGCHYEIAFTSLETYYSIPNINKTNNTFSISRDAGTWDDVEVDTGCYGLIGLNAAIGRKLKVHEMAMAVEFKANYNTFKCTMILKAGFAVKFPEKGSLSTVLGFDKKIYKAGGEETRYESERTVNIMTVNSILVHCDLVGGSYLNEMRVPVIHSFFPLADPGDKIVEKPSEYIYLPIPSDVIRHMTVWLTDQDQNLLDLRGETLTVKFHLRSC